MADPIALGQALQGKTAGSGGVFGTGISPSSALNGALFGAGFIPGAGLLSSLASAGYGLYRGAQGLTSQTPDTIGSYLNPGNPGLIQQGANWLGNQLFGPSDMPLSAATSDATSTPMNRGYSGGTVNVTPPAVDPMALNPDGTPSMAQYQWAANGYGLGGGIGTPARGSPVGYAPGADFMTGFGGQSGYESGGGQMGLRITAR